MILDVPSAEKAPPGTQAATRTMELQLPESVAQSPFVMLTLRVAGESILALVAVDGAVTIVNPNTTV